MPSVVAKVTVSVRFRESEFARSIVGVGGIGEADGSKVDVSGTNVGSSSTPPQAARNATTTMMVRSGQAYEPILIFIFLPAFCSMYINTLHKTDSLFKLQEKG
jgi:hypothetical protein